MPNPTRYDYDSDVYDYDEEKDVISDEYGNSYTGDGDEISTYFDD